MDIVTVIASIGGGIVSGGGLVAAIQAAAGRRTGRADATAVLVRSAMEQVDQLQERVKEADTAAREARQESDRARASMRATGDAARALEDRLNTLIRLIHTPGMDMETLRQRIPLPIHQQNGLA